MPLVVCVLWKLVQWMQFCPCFLRFLTDVGKKIWYTFPHKCTELLWALWKLAQVGLYFSYGKKWSYTYMYTMEVYERKECFGNVSVLCHRIHQILSFSQTKSWHYLWSTTEYFLNLLFSFHRKHVLVMYTVGKKALDTI